MESNANLATNLIRSSRYDTCAARDCLILSPLSRSEREECIVDRRDQASIAGYIHVVAVRMARRIGTAVFNLNSIESDNDTLFSSDKNDVQDVKLIDMHTLTRALM